MFSGFGGTVIDTHRAFSCQGNLGRSSTIYVLAMCPALRPPNMTFLPRFRANRAKPHRTRSAQRTISQTRARRGFAAARQHFLNVSDGDLSKLPPAGSGLTNKTLSD